MKDYLTEFEETEIETNESIYFVGSVILFGFMVYVILSKLWYFLHH